MKLKLTLILLLIAFVIPMNVQSQQFYHGTIESHYVPSLASRSYLEPADVSEREAEDGRASSYPFVIGKDPQTQNDVYASNPHPLQGTITRSLLFEFEATQSGSSPTDPSLGVGPNHVLSVFNTGFRIFDKSGNPLTGQLGANNIFSSGGCCDLTVSYDNAADRWVLSYLFAGSGSIQVAVSDSPDPVTAGWNVYNVPAVFDYNKLSVWSDGYYVTANKNGNPKIWALERDEMIAGNPAQVIGMNLPGLVIPNPGVSFFSPQAFNVTDANLPAPGGLPIVYLQDDSYGGVSNDHVKLWIVDVDWGTGIGVVAAPVEYALAPFISVFDNGNFSNLPQPGGGVPIDAIQATIMNQAQFRKFGTHNSAIFNFTIDTDASAGKLAGIRWVELRQPADNMPWTLFQEGTYTAPDGKHAWMGSMAMDGQGNIGLGYSGMAGPSTPNPTSFRASTYYTGRFAADPPGVMSVAETLIKAGTSNLTNLRYGDYSKIDVDPSNNTNFWFINEIPNPSRKDHVGVFNLAPALADDVGVAVIVEPNDGPLTSSEQVTVTVFNYGLNSQSNIPINLTVDGNSIADEVVPGPIASATSVNYTFTATVDLSMPSTTYNIEATTNLSGDQLMSNDSAAKDVTNTLLGVGDNVFSDGSLKVLDKGQNHFQLVLPTTTYTEKLLLTVTNMIGQNLLYFSLENNGTGYVYDLDMSYAAAGTYIVSLSKGNGSISQKIIVK